jgi:hypothetical protein
MSTTAARSPVVGASAGDADVATVAAVAAAAATTASCCSLVATAVPRGGSPAARGGLDERRLVSTDVSDLSALAGARAGTTGVTLQTRKYDNEHQLLEIKVLRGKYRKPQIGEAPLHLPRRYGGAAVAPVGAVVALVGALAALASASTPLVGSSNDGLVACASTSASGTCATTASAARGDEGEGFHLSGGPTPHRSLLPPPTIALFFLLL